MLHPERVNRRNKQMNRQQMENLKRAAEARCDAIAEKDEASDYDNEMEGALRID